MRSIELFAGGGGLALGAGLSGFQAQAVLEWDKWACQTLRHNRDAGYPLLTGWPIHEGDVRTFDWAGVPKGIELVSGGPPCQPFSMGGKHGAYDDSRDMFPAAVAVVKRLEPQAFVFENVKGLTRPGFANYFQYVLLQLEFPEITRRSGEDWAAHLRRLQVEKTTGAAAVSSLSYKVVATVVNAADYGVPQKRERVFIVGFRRDLDVRWAFPGATYSQDELIYRQWVSEEYWDEHRISQRARPPSPPPEWAGRLNGLRDRLFAADCKPWRTVRDAIGDLPDPQSAKAIGIDGHRYQPGARAYAGHTGSPLDLPAKTLKAGAHGVPGGENMLVAGDGSTRYFTAREAARLQTFPDGYRLLGSWSEVMRQIGNAVPVLLAERVLGSVGAHLLQAQERALRLSVSSRRLAA